MTDIKKLRAALRAKYGARHYSISRTNEVHVWGRALNSQFTCWWFMGSIAHALTFMGLD